MKKSLVRTTLAFCGSAVAALFFCGCGPELAQVEYGSEEANWSKAIGDSYPGYRNPRTAPPAIVDNVSPRLVQAEEIKADEESAAALNDVVVEETAIPAPAEDAVQPAEAPADAKDAAQTETPEKSEKVDAPAAPAADSADAVTSTVYEVKAGDTLSGIAKQHYGDAGKYDIIIKANSIKDPKRIRVGTKLLIPQL